MTTPLKETTALREGMRTAGWAVHNHDCLSQAFWGSADPVIKEQQGSVVGPQTNWLEQLAGTMVEAD